MKKKVVAQVIILLFVSLKCAYAQTTTIEVEFVKRNKVIKVDEKSLLRVIRTNDTLIFPIKEGRLLIPDSLRKNGQKLIFDINRYKLEYEGIPLAWNRLKPKWIITIDTYPFLEENQRTFEKATQKVNWIYIFNNGTGSDFVGYRYDRLKRSK